MARLKSRNHGTRFMSRVEPRVIGGCLEAECPGELVTGTNADEPVIVCTICGFIWEVLSWPSLHLQLQGRAA
jgi:hypothetical protein